MTYFRLALIPREENFIIKKSSNIARMNQPPIKAMLKQNFCFSKRLKKNKIGLITEQSYNMT